MIDHLCSKRIVLNWHRVFSVHKIHIDIPAKVNSVNPLISKYNKLFEKSSKHIKHIKASLKMKKEIQPVFLKAHLVAYFLKDKISEEISKRGVWNFMQRSNWTPTCYCSQKKWCCTFV